MKNTLSITIIALIHPILLYCSQEPQTVREAIFHNNEGLTMILNARKITDPGEQLKILKRSLDSSIPSETLELSIKKGLHSNLPSYHTNKLLFNLLEWATQHTQLDFFKKFIALHEAKLIDIAAIGFERLTASEKIEKELVFNVRLWFASEKRNTLFLAKALVSSLSKVHEVSASTQEKNYAVSESHYRYWPFEIPVCILTDPTKEYLHDLIVEKRSTLLRDAKNNDAKPMDYTITRWSRYGKIRK
jgi:hypothetical protein